MAAKGYAINRQLLATVFCICLSVLLSAFVVPAASAQPRYAQAHQSQRLLSMDEAIAIAKRRHNGEVLAARRSVDRSGEAVYVIKLLTERGVVKKVRIRARR